MTALIYINAAGFIAQRPAVIDFCFPTGSKKGILKEIKKQSHKNVKGKKVVEILQAQEYEDYLERLG